MKRTTTFIASALLAVSLMAADANQLFYTQIQATSTNAVGLPVDISAYKGNAAFIVSIGADMAGYAGLTTTVTIAHSAAGSTWATITNLAGSVASTTTSVGTTNTLYTFPCDLGRLSKYVRASVTQLDGTGSVSVVLSAPFKSQ